MESGGKVKENSAGGRELEEGGGGGGEVRWGVRLEARTSKCSAQCGAH